MSQTVLTKKVPAWKEDLVSEIVQKLEKSPVLSVAGLEKVRSIQVHEIRRKLRGKIAMKVLKNTMMVKAAERVEGKRPGITEFAKRLSGPNLFMFTEMDPLQLAVVLQTSKVRVPAKAGDIATSDIVIPAGNTGLAPGPVISEFGEAKVPTKIEGGSIWVIRDTVVVEKGQAVTAKIAALLSRLSIKPIEAGLALKGAYDRGRLVWADALAIDLEAVRADLVAAAKNAMVLAVEAAYVTRDTLALILGKAYRQAIALAESMKCAESGTRPEDATAPSGEDASRR